ncbi:hypothetical protein BJV74DRAFT_954398 [Russula compacta]|nr:hypothetical protein BJV74DRAFT_954398 [Russula compacta]
MAPESVTITQSLSPLTLGSSIFPDGLLHGSITRERSTDHGEEFIEVQSRNRGSINILLDDALVEIFHFYRRQLEWRYIIFASPHAGLGLQLTCTDETRTRTSLDDIWPPDFPIAITTFQKDVKDDGQDNIIVALEHHDRVIQIDVRGRKLFASEKFSAVTQKPFPVLTYLCLSSSTERALVLHEEFLGRSAPRLRSFSLRNMAFPAFPKLLLSASHLSSFILSDILDTGYISPEAMATYLATLPNLESLSIVFRSHQSRPGRLGPPPPTRAVLPALIHFEFKGVSEYLEDLVSRIDAFNINWLVLDFLMDLVSNIPQLSRFIARTERIRLFNKAKITYSSCAIKIVLGPLTGVVELMMSCGEPDRHTLLMAQVCDQLSPLLSQVEQLVIHEYSPRHFDPVEWFELFDPFPAVQHLHIYDELSPLLARALQELTGERATEVLPTLRSLFFKGLSPSRSMREDIQTFISARQHSDNPVDVHWE